MDGSKLCRICLTKDNLISVFQRDDDNEPIFRKIKYVTDILIKSSDALPKHICTDCLTEMQIANNVKRKTLETDKILNRLIKEDQEQQMMEEYVDGEEERDEEQLEESHEALKSKYLVYEELPDHQTQPKFYYIPTPSSMRIDSSYFDCNPNLKSFVDDYMETKPNLEIIKIVNKDCIKEIEKILVKNEEELRNTETPKNEEFQIVESSKLPMNRSPAKSIMTKPIISNHKPQLIASGSGLKTIRQTAGTIRRPIVTQNQSDVRRVVTNVQRFANK
ncbi:unnamed protein product [Diamesa serratosioi]